MRLRLNFDFCFILAGVEISAAAEDIRVLVGDASLVDFISCDDVVATADTLGEDWEAEVFTRARGLVPENAEGEHNEEDEVVTESDSVTSCRLPEGKNMLLTVKQPWTT